MPDIFIHKRGSVSPVTHVDATVFDVYVDGFRVGQVKFRKNVWKAMEVGMYLGPFRNERYKYLAEFVTQKEAIDHVVLNYMIVRKHWKVGQIKKFEQRALRLQPGLEQESFGNF